MAPDPGRTYTNTRCLTVSSHPRIQELFENPRWYGTDDEWERLKEAHVRTPYGADGVVHVQCPYCTWINTHNVRCGGGHRQCDGPVQSKYTARHARRKSWQLYDCPGYTLVVDR